MPTGTRAVPGDITMLLDQARSGRPGAMDDLFTLVYDELRTMARQQFGSGRGHAAANGLDGTALVHAACARLLGPSAAELDAAPHAACNRSPDDGAAAMAGGRVLDAANRRHFFFLFQRAMHDALVAHVRAQSAQKRGGGAALRTLIEFQADGSSLSADMLDLHQALEELQQHDADGAHVVMLRFFCGRSLLQTADIMRCSLADVRRHWEYARAWLHERLSRPHAAE